MNIKYLTEDYEKVKLILSDIMGNKTEIENILPAKRGKINSCYVVNLKNNKEKFFIKIENNKIKIKYYTGQIERENACMKLMKNNNVPCPEMIRCDTSLKLIDNKYIVTQFIDAPSLCDEWSNLTKEEKNFVKAEVLSIIHKLKDIKTDKFGDIFSGGNRQSFDKWKDAYLNIANILINDCLHSEILNNNDLCTIKSAIYSSYDNINEKYAPCFNHMDLHWENILVHKKNEEITIRAILDFGNSMYGIPFTDEYRLFYFLFFGENFYDEITQKKYDMDKNYHFSCEVLYDLELLAFEKLIGEDWNMLKKIVKNCENYLLAS
jgi:aminoglycoside phosphotransferase (APT) family kinase protein